MKNSNIDSSYKIVIINVFGLNQGDNAILYSVINSLKTVFPQAEYSVFGTSPNDIRSSVKNITIFDNISYISDFKLLHLLNFLRFIRNLIWIYFNNNGINLFFLSKKETKEALHEYTTSDVIISCGGGYLNDNGGYSFLGCLLDIYLGVCLHKPVILYAQSIGPFKNKFLMSITKRILNKVSLIILRDDISMDYIKQLNVVNTKIVVTADEALLLPAVKKERVNEILNKEKINRELPFITISVKPWDFPNLSNPEIYKKNYINALIEFVSHIIKHYEYNILFFSMLLKNSNSNESIASENSINLKESLVKLLLSNDLHTKNDLDLINEITTRVNSDRLIVLKGEYNPCEIKSLINMSDMLMTTRMHPAIFAFAQGIPVLGIAYEPKMINLMERVGQERFLFEIDNINANDLINKFEMLIMEKENIQEKISTNVNSLKNLASENKYIVKNYLEEY